MPAETQSGRVFRVREKGVKPVRGGAAGDLFCRVVIETPVSLNHEQKELLKQFEVSLRAGSHQPREQTFFDGVKKFFTGAVDYAAPMSGIAIFGITGRMGQTLRRVLQQHDP